jgi:hypothetical protein
MECLVRRPRWLLPMTVVVLGLFASGAAAEPELEALPLLGMGYDPGTGLCGTLGLRLNAPRIDDVKSSWALRTDLGRAGGRIGLDFTPVFDHGLGVGVGTFLLQPWGRSVLDDRTRFGVDLHFTLAAPPFDAIEARVGASTPTNGFGRATQFAGGISVNVVPLVLLIGLGSMPCGGCH